MPTYYTPPQTPTSSSAPFAPGSRSSSYSPTSSATGTSTSTRTSSRSTKAPRHEDSKGDRSSKAPYLFLGSIAAASLLAHKYWPTGFPQGEKEDWELSKYAKRAKDRRRQEKAARRGEGRGSTGSGLLAYAQHDDDDRESRHAGYGYREGRREGRYYPVREQQQQEEEEVYSDRDRGWVARFPDAGLGRGRGRSRDRHLRRDGYSEMDNSSSSGSSNGRAISRERERIGPLLATKAGLSSSYFGDHPPAPAQQQYLLERSVSTVGSSTAGPRYLLGRSASTAGAPGGSRLLGLDECRSQQRRYCYDEDRRPEVYISRDVPTRSRRASFAVVR
ncbi:hypothetical protein VTK56DRAFT_7914 [Thermocarpiscus australiensis]